nr:unnamed protein product [uncultured bacterium]
MYTPDKKNSDEILDLKDFEKYKKMTVYTGELFQKDDYLKERGELIEHCGDFLTFDENKKLCSANFCRQRLCPNCQRRKSLKTYGQIKRLSEYLVSEGYEFIHLVLTVRNVDGEQLPDTITDLYTASSRFFSDEEIKRVFKGVLRCLEVSYSKRDCNFHPHLHCLVAVKKSYFKSRYYLKILTIRELWQKHLKADYMPQCWARKCNEKAIAEVAKYAVKPLDLNLCDSLRLAVLKQLFFALHGRRLIQTYGVIRVSAKKLKIDFDSDELSDSEISVSEQKNTYVYNFKLRKYEPRSLKNSK